MPSLFQEVLNIKVFSRLIPDQNDWSHTTIFELEMYIIQFYGDQFIQ